MDAPAALPQAAELDALRAAIDADLPAYLADLERLVNIDCGSYTPEGVNEVGGWTGAFLAGLGAASSTGRIPPGGSATPSWPRSRAARVGRASC